MIDVVFGLFNKKKSKISVVPPPPSGDLPSFPSPQELDNFLRKDKSDRLSLPDLELPELPEAPIISEIKLRPSKLVPPRSMSSMSSIPKLRPARLEEENRPVFLKDDLFQAVINDINNVRIRLEKSNRMIARLEEVHDTQNHLLHNWHETMKDFHEKLLFVDGILFKR